MRFAAASGVLLMTALGTLALRSLEVVVGHRTCVYGYPGCDRLDGHPLWADVVAGVAVVGVAIAGWILARARREPSWPKGEARRGAAPRGSRPRPAAA